MAKVTCSPCNLAHSYDPDGDLQQVYKFLNEHAYCTVRVPKHD